MSTIAIIQVHQCDGCRAVAVLHTDEDDASFRSNWFAGLTVDFCPECINKIENAAAIEGDIAEGKRLMDQATARVFGDIPHSAFRDPHSKEAANA